jgi:sugar (pentulose or hexulose) kinase
MNTLVFDIGKTHIKLHLLDRQGQTLAVVETLNNPVLVGIYPAADVNGIWRWLLENITVLQSTFGIDSISITTHGATAALVNPQQGGNGLVLPVMDYEFQGVEALNSEYAKVRPDFTESGSPALPAGLNLGRQLHWLAKSCPAEFAQSTYILLYPQYWVWRLTGQCWSEVTSLGCHTDLWAPWQRGYSSLVKAMGWQHKFPPLANAWDVAGTVNEEICAATGLSQHCPVHVGIHDSNASYLRYKMAFPEQRFAILSTGTWSIAMNGGADASVLQERRDMLANVDVHGIPVVCSRFMGGREYARICQKLGGALDSPTAEQQISPLIAHGVFCLPAWQPGTGPFGHSNPAILGELPADVPPAALASLYCALMLDYQLDLVDARSTLIIGGAFLKNPLLCGLLAQLRAGQTLLASSDITGTVMGTAQLAHWDEPAETLALDSIQPTAVAGLAEYRDGWRALVLAGEADWSADSATSFL